MHAAKIQIRVAIQVIAALLLVAAEGHDHVARTQDPRALLQTSADLGGQGAEGGIGGPAGGDSGSADGTGDQLPGSFPVPARGDSTDLRLYLDFAAQNNPGIRAAREEWMAATEVAPQAGGLPDPMLTYGYFLKEIETRVGPQRQRLGVSQSFPWFGTLGLRRDVALSGAEAARQKYRQALLDLGWQVAEAYGADYDMARSVEITRENLELLTLWETVLRGRYATGGAKYSDLIHVQVELGRMENQLATLEIQRRARAARLNALMGLPAATDLPWPRALPVVEEVAMTAPVDSGDVGVSQPQARGGAGVATDSGLVAAVLRENPELLSLRALEDRAAVGVDLKRKAYWPDFTVGADWIQVDPGGMPGTEDSGKDAVMAMLGVRLPLWRGKLKAGVEEAEAQKAAARARVENRERTLEGELADLFFRRDDAGRRVELYKDSLIPKGRQSLEAAYSAFESGEADFLLVLDAQRQLLEFDLALARARVDRLRALAGIRTRMGLDPISGGPVDSGTADHEPRGLPVTGAEGGANDPDGPDAGAKTR